MMILHHVLLDAILGPLQPTLLDELEPLFWEAVHDAEIQAAFLRGELPPVARELRLELRDLLASFLPATVEELAERVSALAPDVG